MRRWATIWLMSVILAGCAGGATATTGVQVTTSPSSPAPTPTLVPPTPSASAVAAGLAQLPVHHGDGSRVAVDAGTYVTPSGGFFPGLVLMIPAGWTASETDAGELGLHPADRPNDAILLWKDMAAVVTNNRRNTVGQVLPGVGRTAAALLTWLTTTKDFAIVSKPSPVTVGADAGIKGTQLTLGTSNTANYAWDDCPDNPHCAAILTDPVHWGGNYFAIGGSEVARMFVTTLSYPTGDHTFFVTIDAPKSAELTRLAGDAKPIIDSLQLPKRFVADQATN